jgi:Histidine kinase
MAPLLLSPGPGLEGLLQANVLWPTIVRNLILMALFYINLLYLTPVVLKRYGLLPFLLTIITAIIVVSVVNDLIHITYTEFRGRPGPPPGDFGPGPGRPPMLMLAGPLLSSFLITIMIASVSTSIVFWNDWNRARQEEQERALQKVASELAILKLQVSPHFLFNTLNNIRWLIRSKSDRAEEAVVKLSQLLRYILYQTNDDKVALEKEVDNLQDLISLQKMRLVNGQMVEFNISGNMTGKMITPLLFVPLVENFFKHGDFDNGTPAKISLMVSDTRLVFRTENEILRKTEQLKAESGIGVANVRKRLALHYPNKHLFHVSEKDNRYSVEMELLLD